MTADRSDDVDRYVRGKMGKRERERFELEYFNDEELLREVEITAALVTGMKKQASADGGGIATRAVPAPSLMSKLSALLATPAWGAAATLAAVGLAVLQLFPTGTREVDYRQLLVVSSAVVDGSTLRSSDERNDTSLLTLPRGQVGLVNLDLALPFEALDLVGETLDVALVLEGREGDVLRSVVRVQEDGFSQLLLPTDDLAPGRYTVEVTRSDGEVLMARGIEVTVGD